MTTAQKGVGLFACAAAVVTVSQVWQQRNASPSIVTGIVSTHAVIVRSPVNGVIAQVRSHEGDPVAKHQTLAIVIDEPGADVPTASVAAGETDILADTAETTAVERLARRSQLGGVDAARRARLEIKAPAAGIVSTLALREGDTVTAREPVASLVNPDDLWIRFDIGEPYIECIRLGDQLHVRLASGRETVGTVTFRSAASAFAPQRDIGGTKGNVKAFEVRLKVDNRDRRLAIGASASVMLPFTRSGAGAACAD